MGNKYSNPWLRIPTIIIVLEVVIYIILFYFDLQVTLQQTILQQTRIATSFVATTIKTKSARTASTWNAATATMTATVVDIKRSNLFTRHASVRNLDCSRLIVDKFYAEKIGNKSRVTLNQADQNSLPTDCVSIRQRHDFEREITPEERNYPLAFVRLVYQDYLVHEMQFAALYTPQNAFCFVLDNKSPSQFRAQIRNLSRCFPDNVHILPREYYITSGGANYSRANVECVRYLLAPTIKHKWQYVVLLQNDDIALRTNREMVDIFTVLNGTNDIETEYLRGSKGKRKVDWRINSLNLYPGKNFGQQKLRFANGFSQVSLSRAFAVFITETLNLTGYLNAIDGAFAADEMFFSSLNSDDRLNAPGGFTRFCLDKFKPPKWVHHFTRESIWHEEVSPTRQCHSGYFRHAICVFGVEDLAQLQKFPHLFANKMRTNFDFGAISCQLESIYNRTRFAVRPIALDLYRSYPGVRYRQFRDKYGSDANMSLFNCSSQWPFPFLET